MPTVHFLNVGCGDCIIIEHGSGRVTMIDVCAAAPIEKRATTVATILDEQRIRGNFQMCDKPTNPIAYLEKIGCKGLFRFILSHPDMDHLNGFKALREQVGFSNFWDSGVRREKPDFANSGYAEDDWDEYVAVRDGKREGITVVTPKAGASFKFANVKDDGTAGGDALYIASPTQARVDEVNENDDVNGGSYIIAYHSAGGRFVFPGDAHDEGWNIATTNYPHYVNDCSVLIAPHHGRKSERSYEFLDKIKPKLALFGCAPSEYLAYDAFRGRSIPVITNNQAGNIIMDSDDHGIDVFVENRAFAEKHNTFDENKTKHGCYFIGRIAKPESE